MLTYELALELGIRSPELVERAKEIGIVGIGPSTNLNREQVARLHQEITGMAAPPPPPPPVAPVGGPGFGAGRGHQPPPGPGGGPGPKHDEPMSTASKAVIGGVVVLVVALFAYMVINTGDEPTKQAAAGSDGTPAVTAPRVDPCAPNAATSTSNPVCADVEGGLVGAPVTSSTTLPDGYVLGVDNPRDKRKFCKGARSVFALEQKLAQAQTANEFRDAIVMGKAQWLVDAHLMEEGAPPRLDNPLQLYMKVYGDLMVAITPTTDETALARAFIRARSSDIASAAVEVTGAYLDNCR